jgi:hypothetical protein
MTVLMSGMSNAFGRGDEAHVILNVPDSAHVLSFAGRLAASAGQQYSEAEHAGARHGTFSLR